MASFAYLTALFVGCLFLITGSEKVRSEGFAGAVADYELLPLTVVRRVAPVLPWIEIVLGAGLVVGLLPAVLLGAAGLLMFIFSVGILINLLRGRDIDCGCRSERRPISWILFGQDITIAAAAFASIFGQPSGAVQNLLKHGALAPSAGAALTFALVDAWLTYRVFSVAFKARQAVGHLRTV